MRNLIYECNYRGIYVKTVKTYADAEMWKAQGGKYTCKAKLTEVSETETEKAKAERLRKITKRNKLRAEKRQVAVG